MMSPHVYRHSGQTAISSYLFSFSRSYSRLLLGKDRIFTTENNGREVFRREKHFVTNRRAARNTENTYQWLIIDVLAESDRGIRSWSFIHLRRRFIFDNYDRFCSHISFSFSVIIVWGTVQSNNKASRLLKRKTLRPRRGKDAGIRRVTVMF